MLEINDKISIKIKFFLWSEYNSSTKYRQKIYFTYVFMNKIFINLHFVNDLFLIV